MWRLSRVLTHAPPFVVSAKLLQDRGILRVGTGGDELKSGARRRDDGGFEHGEWYLCGVSIEARVFRDRQKRDGVLAPDHLLALHGGDLAGGHLETVGNLDDSFVFASGLHKASPPLPGTPPQPRY